MVHFRSIYGRAMAPLWTVTGGLSVAGVGIGVLFMMTLTVIILSLNTLDVEF